jgi:hypothetical protein
MPLAILHPPVPQQARFRDYWKLHDGMKRFFSISAA